MTKNVCVATGGFDPLHSGHINYLKACADLGDQLLVGLNSDKWLIRKKGAYLLPYKERYAVLAEMKFINTIYSFDDEDNSAIELLEHLKTYHPDRTYIFCNGGDRTASNIYETEVEGVIFAFNVGGEKTGSSSNYLDDYHNNRSINEGIINLTMKNVQPDLETEIYKNNIKDLQGQLQESYKRIAELQEMLTDFTIRITKFNQGMPDGLPVITKKNKKD